MCHASILLFSSRVFVAQVAGVVYMQYVWFSVLPHICIELILLLSAIQFTELLYSL